MAALLHDLPWCDQFKYEQAEVVLVKSCCVPASKPRESPISASFAMISADIESSLQTSSTITISKQPAVAVKTDSMSSSDATRIKSLEEDNQTLHRTIQELTERITKLEAHCFSGAGQQSQVTVAKEPVAREQAEEDDDDDVDLFGSDDDEDDEFEKLKAKRIAEYEAKKAKKPATVAKSNLILDVKPWDDETDMNEIEKAVRSIKADGLVWGASKFVPLAYGIKKLQITCVVEDDKIGTDFLEESITAFEDLIQSMDVVAFNKI